ncbi:hypothetical protein MTO96_013590 [Rhipicephalus appendiculatus]
MTLLKADVHEDFLTRCLLRTGRGESRPWRRKNTKKQALVKRRRTLVWTRLAAGCGGGSDGVPRQHCLPRQNAASTQRRLGRMMIGAAANFLTSSVSVAVEPEGGGFGGVGWQCEENTLAFNSQTVEEEGFASFGRKVRCSGGQKKGFKHAKPLRPRNRWAALRRQKRWRWGRGRRCS